MMNLRLPLSYMFCLNTASAAEQDPAKKSSTISPPSSLVAIWSILATNRVGLGVSKTESDEEKATCASSSFLASWVCPTSLYLHKVCGTIPCLTSFKKRFNLGMLLPLTPHQIRLSLSSCSNFSFDTLQ